MGQSKYERVNKEIVNNEKIITIDLQLDKTCYFPGELITGKIILFPTLESIFQIMEDPQLNIILFQKSHYSYKRNKCRASRTDEKKLTDINLNFKNYIKGEFSDYSFGYSIPFSIQIPSNAYPTYFQIMLKEHY